MKDFPKSLSLEKAPRLGIESPYGIPVSQPGTAEKGSIGAGGFALGMLLGAMLGAAVGVLMAPKAGSESRALIQDKATEVVDKASEVVGRAREKSRDLVDQAKEQSRGIMDKSKDLVERAQRFLVQAGGGSQFQPHGELTATEEEQPQPKEAPLQGQYGTA